MDYDITRRNILQLIGVSIGISAVSMPVTAQDGMTFLQAYTGHSDDVGTVIFGSDDTVYSGADDEEVHKINPENMERIDVYTGQLDDIRAFAFGPNGYLYVGGAFEVELHKINPEDMSQVDTYTEHSSAINSLIFDNDGMLYSGSGDNEVHKINPESMGQVDTYNYGGTVRSLAVGPNEDLYMGGTTGLVSQINTSDMSFIDSYDYSDTIYGVSFGPDGNMYVGGLANTIEKINPNTMSLIDTFAQASESIISVVAAPDSYVYASATSGDIYQVNMSDMGQTDIYTNHNDAVGKIDFGLDGNLYSASNDQEVHQIDTGTVVINPDEDLAFDARNFVVVGESIPYDVRFNDDGNWQSVNDELDSIESDNPSIASIDEENHQINGHESGEVTITATYEGYEIDHSLQVGNISVEDWQFLPFSRKIEAITFDRSIQTIAITTFVGSIASNKLNNPWIGLGLACALLIIASQLGFISTGITFIAVFFTILASMYLRGIDRKDTVNVNVEERFNR